MKKVCVRQVKNSRKLLPFSKDFLLNVNQIVLLEVKGILSDNTTSYLLGRVSSIVIKDKVIYKIMSNTTGVTIPIVSENIINMLPISENELKLLNCYTDDSYIVYKFNDDLYSINVPFLLNMMTQRPFKECIKTIISMSDDDCSHILHNGQLKVTVPKNTCRVVIDIITTNGSVLSTSTHIEDKLLIDLERL